MAKKILTHSRLLSLLDYDPETGVFTWLQSLCRSRKMKGKTAGHFGKRYIEIRIDRRSYLAHRLAFFYMTGNLPKKSMDHVNLDPKDNRWCNLREATNSQNSANKTKLRTNKSGFKGVRAGTKLGRWRAVIWTNDKSISLGTFDTKEEANEAYKNAAIALHGEFARW